ncbi:MAG TPA: glycosyltransferase family 39 protein [Roseiflexaceae bacterium]|nr:glycosyltransferase family 39 protein [Roseiflexaceae bacterium]
MQTETLRSYRDRAEAMPRASLWQVALTALLLFGAALLPRAFGLADFFTIDEADHWILRVRLFSEALHRQNWAGTNLTGHPGVMTMWFGSIGRSLATANGVAPSSDSAAYLAMLRLPLTVVNSLAVVAGYLLLCRIVRPSTALLAGILWATEPFVIAHSRLLHVDALMTSFSTICILLLLLGSPLARRPLTGAGRWVAIGASGSMAGLALLSKVSGLVLLPWAGLFLAAVVLADRRLIAAIGPGWWHSAGWWIIAARRTLLPYLLWLGCLALTMFVVWPAMWVAPETAVGDMLAEALLNGGQPHAWGNYFLGQSIADPGPLFYLVAVLWRSSPLMLIGLLALPLAFWRSRWDKDHGARNKEADEEGESASFVLRRSSLVLLALLSWVLLFGLAVTVGGKKFDRYSLPIWPTLDVLAAIALLALGHRIQAIGSRLVSQSSVSAPQSRLKYALLGAIAIAALAYDMSYQPYYLSYFNPLLGGGPVAQDLLLVGWGEGMEHVGAWISARPDRDRGNVLTWIPSTLQPFLPREIRALDIRATTIAMRHPPPNYSVIYARGAMRQDTPELAAIVSRTPPLYQLRMNGLEYATIYQMPRPFDTPVGARFGDGLELGGFSQQQIGSTLVISPSWSVQRDQPGGHFVFAHVLAADGRRVAQIDAAIDDGMFPEWQAGQQFGTALPIALPSDLPAGEYRVVLGVYDPSANARLPLAGAPAAPPELDGPDALLLTTIRR